MCSIALNGSEIEKKRFRVLSGGHEWKSYEYGNFPGRATYIGDNEDGKRMYIGRAYYDGNYIPGTVDIQIILIIKLNI